MGNIDIDIDIFFHKKFGVFTGDPVEKIILSLRTYSYSASVTIAIPIVLTYRCYEAHQISRA